MTPFAASMSDVLIVDDMRLSRVLLAKILDGLGYRASHAANGEAALARLRQGAVAAVFLDWGLPGMGGDAVLRRLRAKENPPPVVAITADDSAEMRARCLAAGAAVFLGKTFSVESVRAALAAIGLRPIARGGGAGGPDAEVWRLLRRRGVEQLLVERARLGDASREGATEPALRALHNLVSLAGMMDASELAEAARELESRVRSRGLMDADTAGLDRWLGLVRAASALQAEDAR